VKGVENSGFNHSQLLGLNSRYRASNSRLLISTILGLPLI
jgi:hypothetical protein